MKIIMCILIFVFSITGCSTNVSSPKSITQAAIPKVKQQVVQDGLFLYSESDCKKKITPECLCEADIAYPVISGLGDKMAQLELNNAFKKDAEDSQCPGKPIIFTGEMEREEFSLSYFVTFNSPEILSISTNSYRFSVGAAHANATTSGLIIDVDSGKVLTTNDIFGKNIDQVNQVLYDKLIDRAGGEPTTEESNLYVDEIKVRKGRFIEGDVCNDCSLSLSKEGVIVIFTNYTVDNAVDGNPEVLIPNRYIVHPAITHYFK